MATLTLTVGANADDYVITDLDSPNSDNPGVVGGVSVTPIAGHGMGYRFTGGSLLDGATVNSCYMSLMKSGNEWNNQAFRWVVEDSDSPSTFTNGSPTRPGDRAIVAGTIPAEVLNISQTSGTRYNRPSTLGLQQNLGTLLTGAVGRAGYTDTVAVINNSDQDASAYQNTQRGNYHHYESATANSEPQLVIDYTAAAGATSFPFAPAFRSMSGIIVR